MQRNDSFGTYANGLIGKIVNVYANHNNFKGELISYSFNFACVVIKTEAGIELILRNPATVEVIDDA